MFGSRFLTDRPRRVLYFWHSVGNKLLTLASNVFTNLNLTDMETCYKMFRRTVIQAIELREDRFGFVPEVTARIARGNWRIYEVDRATMVAPTRQESGLEGCDPGRRAASFATRRFGTGRSAPSTFTPSVLDAQSKLTPDANEAAAPEAVSLNRSRAERPATVCTVVEPDPGVHTRTSTVAPRGGSSGSQANGAGPVEFGAAACLTANGTVSSWLCLDLTCRLASRTSPLLASLQISTFAGDVDDSDKRCNDSGPTARYLPT